MEYRDKTIPELEKYIDELHDAMRDTAQQIIVIAENDRTPKRQIEYMRICMNLLNYVNPLSYPFLDDDYIVVHD